MLWEILHFLRIAFEPIKDSLLTLIISDASAVSLETSNDNHQTKAVVQPVLSQKLKNKENLARLRRLTMLGLLAAPLAACGSDGEDGLSAYQVWLNAGNTGTEQDFLDSLVATPGEPGIPGEPGLDGEPGAPAASVTIAAVTGEPSGNYLIQASNATDLVVFEQNGSARFDSVKSTDAGDIFGPSGFFPADLTVLDLNGVNLTVRSIDGNVYSDFLGSTALTGIGNVLILLSEASTTSINIDTQGDLTFDMISDDVILTLNSGSIVNITDNFIVDDGTVDITAIPEGNFFVGGDVVLNSGLVLTVEQLLNIDGGFIGMGDLNIVVSNPNQISELVTKLTNLDLGDVQITVTASPDQGVDLTEFANALKASGLPEISENFDTIILNQVVSEGNLNLNGFETLKLNVSADVTTALAAEDLISATINLDGDVTLAVGPFEVDKLETLTINLGDAGAYTFAGGFDAELLTTLTITGGRDSTFAIDIGASEPQVKIIDLSGFSGGNIPNVSQSIIDINGNFTNIGEAGAGFLSMGRSAFENDVTIKVGEGDLTVSLNNGTLFFGSSFGTIGRETFEFVGDDIGDVNIIGFEASVGASGDRLDFSQINGLNDTDDLNFVETGSGQFTITAANGQFSGAVVLNVASDVDVTDLTASVSF